MGIPVNLINTEAERAAIMQQTEQLAREAMAAQQGQGMPPEQEVPQEEEIPEQQAMEA